jgi:lipoprotein-releasing system ATP-binding protein
MLARGTPLIEAVGVEKCYHDGPAVVRVLHELDLEVAEGECVAVVGESGIGKSTLLHLLGGLDRPTAGRLMIAGVDLGSRAEPELAAFRNREVGFVFQFHQLLADFTALENVMLPALIARDGYRQSRDAAAALLERVGLGDRLEHRPGELSGGEQQRVAVARAVVRRPRLLLADEPTGNLDPATGARVEQLLLELNREAGSTLIVATHSDRLATVMTRRLRLRAGRLMPDQGPAPALEAGGRGA